MQLQIQTVLNKVHPVKHFVYADVRLVPCKGSAAARIEARVVPRKNSRARCYRCDQPGATYDHQPERRFDFIPLWGLLVFLLYAPRRVDCGDCGVHVEAMPWARGKSSMTAVYMLFLATWARRMSWTETARVFASTWDNVYRAVKWVVEYGLEHRDLNGIAAIGVDEVQYRKGHKYLGCFPFLWKVESHGILSQVSTTKGDSRANSERLPRTDRDHCTDDVERYQGICHGADSHSVEVQPQSVGPANPTRLRNAAGMR